MGYNGLLQRKIKAWNNKHFGKANMNQWLIHQKEQSQPDWLLWKKLISKWSFRELLFSWLRPAEILQRLVVPLSAEELTAHMTALQDQGGNASQISLLRIFDCGGNVQVYFNRSSRANHQLSTHFILGQLPGRETILLTSKTCRIQNDRQLDAYIRECDVAALLLDTWNNNLGKWEETRRFLCVAAGSYLEQVKAEIQRKVDSAVVVFADDTLWPADSILVISPDSQAYRFYSSEDFVDNKIMLDQPRDSVRDRGQELRPWKVIRRNFIGSNIWGYLRSRCVIFERKDSDSAWPEHAVVTIPEQYLDELPPGYNFVQH